MMGADDGRIPVAKRGKGTNPKARQKRRRKRAAMHVMGPGAKHPMGPMRYRST